jgi:hypothetical protein
MTLEIRSTFFAQLKRFSPKFSRGVFTVVPTISGKINTLPPLNIDVTLHLMKFESPNDGFNLAPSGALEGVKNA